MISLADSWTNIEESFGSYSINAHGEVRNNLSGKVIAQNKDACGYLQVGMYIKATKKQISRRVHRLVAKAFVEGHKDGLVVNHINGVKDDNRIENLEWVTVGENNRHAIRTGLAPKPPVTKARARKLNSEDARRAMAMRRDGCTLKEISETFGVSQQTIRLLCLGVTYKEISRSNAKE